MLQVFASGPPSEPFNFTILTGSETASSLTLEWVSSFHGGANQTFYIFYKTNNSEWMEGPRVFGGRHVKDKFTTTVENLSAGTRYLFLIITKNEYGENNKTAIISAATKTYVPGKLVI